MRLYEALEAKHQCDYIFVDLNPGTSKLNYLAMLGCAVCACHSGPATVSLCSLPACLLLPSHPSCNPSRSPAPAALTSSCHP